MLLSFGEHDLAPHLGLSHSEDEDVLARSEQYRKSCEPRGPAIDAYFDGCFPLWNPKAPSCSHELQESLVRVVCLFLDDGRQGLAVVFACGHLVEVCPVKLGGPRCVAVSVVRTTQVESEAVSPLVSELGIDRLPRHDGSREVSGGVRVHAFSEAHPRSFELGILGRFRWALGRVGVCASRGKEASHEHYERQERSKRGSDRH